jgi:hypothetical protein
MLADVQPFINCPIITGYPLPLRALTINIEFTNESLFGFFNQSA